MTTLQVIHERLESAAYKVTDNFCYSCYKVVEFCRSLGLDAELVGEWVWVTFAEKPDAEIRKSLKDFGFKWSKRRGKWAHNCGKPTKPARIGNPWDKYTHRTVSGPNFATA
jgi:hypothetical protein